MRFNDYIHNEQKTITEFINSSSNLVIRDIYNQSYSKFDFDFISAGTPNQYFTPEIEGVCEVKTRQYQSNKYPSGTLLELDKLQGITEEVARRKSDHSNINKNIKGYYLVSYTDIAFLFDLETIEVENIQFIKLPKTTASNGRKEYVFKAVLIIPFDKSIYSY